ncbi:phosphoglycerate dehydrogenase [Clostridium arbusti]|uniref:phosphoglycerate dehydrogenase n=1 Tax=Clostridium arbusti TaxID=1137848 RepID=UPI000287A851|nr:phosphoglycerate dehydrogenase [Clostridium arbusti]
MITDVLCTYDYGREKMDKLSSLGYKIMIKDEKNLIYKDDLKDVEILITYNPFSTLNISNMKKLKWIQLLSNGIDQLPNKYIEENNILVTNNKNSYSIPVAEWIVLKILEIYKNSYSFYKNMRKKLWKEDQSLLELDKKIVGILGTGGISVEAAKRLKGFNVTLLGCNTGGTKTTHFDKCYPKSEMKEMLKQCDVVVNLFPGTKETYHIIDKHCFEVMRAGVVFISVGRGEVINEKDLIQYIKNKKFRGVALDVFENEPLDKENSLWNFDNVIITPHNAWISEKNHEKIYDLVYENMTRYTMKQCLINKVNLQRGY